MSTAPRYLPHYTVVDYEQWEGDWELWQGIPVAMTPSPFGAHQRCSLRLAQSLLTAIEAEDCKSEVLQEIDSLSEGALLRDFTESRGNTGILGCSIRNHGFGLRSLVASAQCHLL